ncbi:MAG: thiosulfate oxidation carrier complex protein SoxZ [Gammaproteobacteria bacterium]|nr:thiosulfate oxidation carrier complex protein SoxZ [Gammaproteobacteria bacterium]
MATKIKARKKGNATEILVLVQHPMETGARKDKKTKKLIPAHFIQTMVFAINGKTVADVDMSTGVSKNPLIGIRVKNAKPGDKIDVSWKDNKGETGGAKTTVK